jgi:hypothetical protein
MPLWSHKTVSITFLEDGVTFNFILAGDAGCFHKSDASFLVDHSPLTSAEVNKMWIYTSTPMRLHGVVWRWLWRHWLLPLLSFLYPFFPSPWPGARASFPLPFLPIPVLPEPSYLALSLLSWSVPSWHSSEQGLCFLVSFRDQVFRPFY